MKVAHVNKIEKIDKSSFEELFRTYFTGLCSFAKKYVQDLDIGKDIVHDVFVNMWDKRESIDTSKSIKSYLFTSVHNRCLNYIRDNKKFDQNEVDLERLNTDQNWESSDKLVEIELEEKINKVLDSLPEKCREIFLMNRFEGLKYKEVAEKLDISVKTVETQMSKALKILRENLVEYLAMVLFGILYYLNI
ncbi:MAG: RNA polymerase sigma-70 factor [Bacteroidia bacterium]|nr:RNA polymerase sigma-70 factor [Bacteroidia bacterium]